MGETRADSGVNPWQEHVGRTTESVENICAKGLQGLAALLDYPGSSAAGPAHLPWPDIALPPFCHWLNANIPVPQSALGADGHPARGDFIPEFPFPQRMWAGSRVWCPGDLPHGQPLLHRQTIKSIQPKTGRSGDMLFLTLLHEFFTDGQLVLLEEQDLVYRAPGNARLERPIARPADEVLAGQACDWRRSLQMDPALLFRYSAVSFNTHRIHYDRDYATSIERYPGLVVQGPLTATLLLDLYARNNPGRRIADFSFRGLRPLYDGDALYLLGKQTVAGASLWALDAHGDVAMEMELTASQPQER